MKSFSVADRSTGIQDFALAKTPRDVDLLIVGGGITGAGVARDAASRGMKVLLVEKNDFAFGTSSRSTKLIHGGLRYLENLEFKLVFEALSERQKLFEIAPHLVHPLRFLLPVYEEGRVGMFKMGCGMWLYDLLACFRGGNHQRLNRNETMSKVPFLNSDGLKGSYEYSDAYMDDDRLVLETLRSPHELGATCLNYVAAETPIFEEGRITGMNCRDSLGGQTFAVKARHVISTVGPWTDHFGKKMFSDWKKLLKPSKGIHLTLPRDRFPVESAVVLSDDHLGRIVFAVPRDEMVIVGTTDTSYDDDPANVRADRQDVEYLNQMLNSYFPKGEFKISDYISSYAGIRPLVKTDTNSVGKTSREHTILSDPRGITFVAGGKYTTYRKMAEEIVDESLPFFDGNETARFKRSQTVSPLNPSCSLESLQRSKQELSGWASKLNVEIEEMSFFLRRHGEEAYAIRSNGASRWESEAEFAIDNTMCLNLLDFYVRRTPLFLAEKDHGVSVLPLVAGVFSRRLNWNSDETADQVASVKNYIQSELVWKNS